LGGLPEAGKWVRLEVPATVVGLKPGETVVGWAFTLFGGTAYFDRAGIQTEVPQAGGTYDTLAGWIRSQRALKGAGLPANIVALVNLDRAKRTPEQHKQLKDYFVQNVWTKAQEHLAPLRKQLAGIEAQRTVL